MFEGQISVLRLKQVAWMGQRILFVFFMRNVVVCQILKNDFRIHLIYSTTFVLSTLHALDLTPLSRVLTVTTRKTSLFPSVSSRKQKCNAQWLLNGWWSVKRMIRVNIMKTLLGLVLFLESVQLICRFSLTYCCYTDVRGDVTGKGGNSADAEHHSHLHRVNS